MNEGIHLDLDTWIVPGQIRKANLCLGSIHPDKLYPTILLLLLLLLIVLRYSYSYIIIIVSRARFKL